MEEWKEYKLGDVCTISSSKRIFASEYQKAGIPFYRGKEIIEKQNGTSISNELFISEERFNEIKSKYGVPKEGDMLLSSVGTLGVPYIVHDETFYFKDGNLTWFYDYKNINNYFLYYWFLSPKARFLIDTKAIGSTQKALTIETLKKFDILLPSKDTQNKIVAILKSLDDKIEVNRRINENLEQQAQALFKSWFVDFEPFKNGEFVDSELGMIPKGWRVGKLSEIADVNPYRNLKKGINALYLDMKNMPTKGSFPMNWDYKLYSGGMKFKNEDTLMARITPCLENGKVAYVNFLEDDEIAFGSTEYIVMTPKDGFMPELLYFLCRDDFFKGYATKNMNGSSGRQRVSAETIGKYPIAIPPKVQIESIASYYKGIMDNVKKNGLESRRLASLRDTLLPKLMSGELRVGR